MCYTIKTDLTLTRYSYLLRNRPKTSWESVARLENRCWIVSIHMYRCLIKMHHTLFRLHFFFNLKIVHHFLSTTSLCWPIPIVKCEYVHDISTVASQCNKWNRLNGATGLVLQYPMEYANFASRVHWNLFVYIVAKNWLNSIQLKKYLIIPKGNETV